jgi:uncharacterized protein (TIGR03067 family)
MTLTLWMKHSFLAAALTVLATSAGLSGATASADEAALSPALKAVQGVWVSSGDSTVDAKWTVENDKITATVNGVDYIGKLTLDKEAKPHPAWTIELTDGPGDAKGKEAKGVYKLDGEKLVVNISVPGGDRPKDFDPAEDAIYLFELKKEKKS